MANIELTELQTRIYEIVKEDETISKKNIAKRLDFPDVRKVASPVKSMLDSGVLVTDEYADYSIAAGVREDELGSVCVPAVAVTPAREEPYAEDADEEDEDNLYTDYWRKHPEELVTAYQEEGLDALKRAALQDAMENAPGVGVKALNSVLRWFDKDEELRRSQTTLMRALEDSGVRHNMVGRIAHETFLPEKQYSTYIQADREYVLERGQRSPQRTRVVGNRRRDAADEHYEERYEEPDRRRQPQQSFGEEPPQWYHALMLKIDMLNMDRNDRPSPESQRPHIVVEPVLDEGGNPIPDPNNPGQYLERKMVYDAPGSVAPVQSAPDPHMEQVLAIVEDQKDELARLSSILSEHETDRKISAAIGERVDPLLTKISGLEKAEPIRKAGLSDKQYQLQTEKEIFQGVTESVESTVANVLAPILEGLQDTQKMQAMQGIIAMEQSQGVPPGTYLKYMAGGGGGDEITKERVGNTIDLINAKTQGGK